MRGRVCFVLGGDVIVVDNQNPASRPPHSPTAASSKSASAGNRARPSNTPSSGRRLAKKPRAQHPKPIELTRGLAATHTSEQIAEHLNAAGLPTSTGGPFTATHVQWIRWGTRSPTQPNVIPPLTKELLVERSDPTPNTAPAQQAAQPAAGVPTKAPQWRALIIGLLIALVMIAIMGATYISANHAVVAHNLPWGVTGSSPLTTAVQKSISLDIHHYANQTDRENAANHAKIYGGFVPQTNTLVLNVAASLRAPFVMPVAYQKAAKQAGVKLQAKAINPLPSQDPEGVVPGLTLFVLLVGGYLGSTFAMQRTKTAAAHRRVAALFGYSVVAALAIDLIAGPLLGAAGNCGPSSR